MNRKLNFCLYLPGKIPLYTCLENSQLVSMDVFQETIEVSKCGADVKILLRLQKGCKGRYEIILRDLVTIKECIKSNIRFS